jgi:hypothetical protein
VTTGVGFFSTSLTSSSLSSTTKLLTLVAGYDYGMTFFGSSLMTYLTGSLLSDEMSPFPSINLSISPIPILSNTSPKSNPPSSGYTSFTGPSGFFFPFGPLDIIS